MINRAVVQGDIFVTRAWPSSGSNSTSPKCAARSFDLPPPKNTSGLGMRMRFSTARAAGMPFSAIAFADRRRLDGRVAGHEVVRLQDSPIGTDRSVSPNRSTWDSGTHSASAAMRFMVVWRVQRRDAKRPEGPRESAARRVAASETCGKAMKRHAGPR